MTPLFVSWCILGPGSYSGLHTLIIYSLSSLPSMIPLLNWDDFSKHDNIFPRRHCSVTLCLNSPDTRALILLLLDSWMDLKWPGSILNPSTCSWSRKEEPLTDPILLWDKVYKSTKGTLNPEALREWEPGLATQRVYLSLLSQTHLAWYHELQASIIITLQLSVLDIC